DPRRRQPARVKRSLPKIGILQVTGEAPADRRQDGHGEKGLEYRPPVAQPRLHKVSIVRLCLPVGQDSNKDLNGYDCVQDHGGKIEFPDLRIQENPPATGTCPVAHERRTMNDSDKPEVSSSPPAPVQPAVQLEP